MTADHRFFWSNGNFHLVPRVNNIIWARLAVCRRRKMPRRADRTFSLSSEEVRYIDALVASGAYGSPSEVIRAGLTALRERDSKIEDWLRDEVVPVYDAMRSDPGRALSIGDVASAIDARHADRVKRPKRGV
jgi:antitoxin ParD1/3/4